MHQVQVPWAREGSGFTLLMEALMMLLSAEMPLDAMADLLDEHDTRLWRVLMHYIEQAHAKSDIIIQVGGLPKMWAGRQPLWDAVLSGRWPHHISRPLLCAG